MLLALGVDTVELREQEHLVRFQLVLLFLSGLEELIKLVMRLEALLVSLRSYRDPFSSAAIEPWTGHVFPVLQIRRLEAVIHLSVAHFV